MHDIPKHTSKPGHQRSLKYKLSRTVYTCVAAQSTSYFSSVQTVMLFSRSPARKTGWIVTTELLVHELLQLRRLDLRHVCWLDEDEENS